MKKLIIILSLLLSFGAHSQTLLSCHSHEGRIIFIDKESFNYDSTDDYLFSQEALRGYEILRLEKSTSHIDRYYIQLPDHNFEYYAFITINKHQNIVSIKTYESDEGSLIENIVLKCRSGLSYNQRIMRTHFIDRGQSVLPPGSFN